MSGLGAWLWSQTEPRSQPSSATYWLCACGEFVPSRASLSCEMGPSQHLPQRAVVKIKIDKPSGWHISTGKYVSNVSFAQRTLTAERGRGGKALWRCGDDILCSTP